MRLLKINSLPSTKESPWIDRDIIMIYACFQILEDYIEKEKGHLDCNYEANKEWIDELRFLYEWWKKRKDLEDYDEDIQDKEDEEMLIRLIKKRLYLWS